MQSVLVPSWPSQLQNHLGGHLCTIVGANVLRNAMDKYNVRQYFDDTKTVDATGNPDSQAFAGM
jgi:hypothetical protein